MKFDQSGLLASLELEGEHLHKLLEFMEQHAYPVLLDETNRIIKMSETLAALLHLEQEDAMGRTYEQWSGLNSGEWRNAVQSGESISITGKDDTSCTFQLLPYELPHLGRTILFHRNLTLLEAAKAAIDELSATDSLTGLPNRKELEAAIAKTKLDKTPATLIIVDINRFKFYNDTLGPFTGDELIVQMGEKLRRFRTQSFQLFRTGGDKFAFLLEGVYHKDTAAAFAERMLPTIREPFFIKGKELSISVSIGAAVRPGPDSEGRSLIQQATTAVQSAKEDGTKAVVFYDPELRCRYDKRLQLEHRLRRALRKKNFSLHFQPQYDFATKNMTGVEALLRWTDEELGMVPPARFIPAAEESGLIVPLGRWVLMEACREGKRLTDAGHQLSVGVNISPLQFQSRDFVATVRSVLQSTGFDAKLLDLEITENDLLYHREECLETLQQLKELGVRISIDDFGTGYSSLSYLRQFPVDTLKIDKSFIREVLDNRNDQAIVASIIQLAHNMNMRVIAEGVEKQETIPFLKDRACDAMQGFLYSRPMPAESLHERLGMAT
ncbi:putative bifunctional diguanylate cyclase/phosphodiesterase [Alkalicoccus luteus]|uniref:Bifunctional diguanylate cyclase/phosphodiesterase n=1 Tax=Alkalicoccus luteus TaxID=1237094 RepID=A0A969PP09_9BACI|nr:bifunctional diguanylate cyclase/phosphodiesterase [Alkalicoccus luteus]NJP36793.1 bifunctional diguanylate cyclase/phosphodiesterase [Alkalicoccus luteus]